MFFWSVLAFLFLMGCTSTPEATTTINDTPTTELDSTIPVDNIFAEDKQQNWSKKIFTPLLDSTFYTNQKVFIEQLGIYYDKKHLEHTEIIAFESHKVYGITDSIWFINCKTTLDGYGCPYPMMHTQYLFNAKGQLIHKGESLAAKFIPLIQDSISVFSTVQQDCEGNGQHHVYLYQQGQMIDVFNILMETTPKTVDSNPNGGMFQKNYLTLRTKDLNQDGFEDLVLTGKWLVLEHKGKKYSPSAPYRRRYVTYKLLYKPTKEYYLLENKEL